MVCEVQWLQTATPDVVSPRYLERQRFARSKAKRDATGESAARQHGRIHKACWSAFNKHLQHHTLKPIGRAAKSSTVLFRAVRRAADAHSRLQPADKPSLKKRQWLSRGDSLKWRRTSYNVWWMSCDSVCAQVMEARTPSPYCRHRQPLSSQVRQSNLLLLG